MTEADIQILKRAFAYELLKDDRNPYQAAMKACGGDIATASEMSRNWLHDADVELHKEELLKEHGEDAFLPSKSEMVQAVYQRAQTARRDEDFVKLMKLAADMRGFIEKPGVTVNNNNNVTTNKVMVVPQPVGSNGDPIGIDEWEQQLIEQQNSLISME